MGNERDAGWNRYRDVVRNRPVETALLTVAPLLLAAAQLANGYLTELPFAYAAGFAAVMTAFSVLVTRYNHARYRLDRLGTAAD